MISKCSTGVGRVSTVRVVVLMLVVAGLVGTVGGPHERLDRVDRDMSGETNLLAGSDEIGPSGAILEQISKQVVVPAGREYFIFFDGSNETLEEMPLPNHLAGFPQQVVDAMERAPNWLKSNLTMKFEQMADVDIEVNDFSTIDLADLDSDGDFDVIVGQDTGGLLYYENVDPYLRYYEGSDVYVSGVYILNNSVFSGIPLNRPDPAMADLDGDNDVDMLVGVSMGVLKYENKGLPTLPSWGTPTSLGISLNFTALDAADLDNDGDFDIIIGDESGELYYSENIGP
ncbi:MAG: FG-GAP repeat domain-containing protein, partial [Thermoplasmata archaeon]